MTTFGERFTICWVRWSRRPAFRNRELRELAEDVGVTSPALSQWLTRPTVPDPRNVEIAARALGVDSGWLAYGSGITPEWWDDTAVKELRAHRAAERERRVGKKGEIRKVRAPEIPDVRQRKAR